MALGIVDEAQTAAAVLGHNFPDSPWYKDAYGLRAGRRRSSRPRTRAPGSARRSRRSGWAARARSAAAGVLRSTDAHPPWPGLFRPLHVSDDGESRSDGLLRTRLGMLGTAVAMLTRLSIRDIVLIDRLDIDFAPGLSVLTGETGAGKSILLDAFALALGARGDASLVRQGAEQGQVTAAFDVPARPSGARAARRQRHPGRGRADPAPRAARRRPHPRLRQRPAGRACRCCSSARRGAGRDPRPARRARAGRCRDPPRAARRLWRASTTRPPRSRGCGTSAAPREEAVAAHRAEVERAQREADWLRHAVEELTRARARARRGDRARRAAHRHDAGREGRRGSARRARGGGGQRSRRCRRWRPRCAGSSAAHAQAPALIEPAVKALDAALTALDEARGASRSGARAPPTTIRASSSASRSGCSRCAPRAASTMSPVDELAALARALCRRSRADRCRRRAARRARSGGARGATRAYRKAAAALSGGAPQGGGEARQGGERRAQAAQARARDASPPRSRPTPDAAGPHGIDRVEFWVQTNPGTRPGPLMKVASGGELARFLLALKVVLADRGSAPTLVFDEIDTGVGGAVADAIGVRLARLAARVQVVAVTHAPQVAARADRHYLITKDALDARQAGRDPRRRGRGRAPPRGDRPHARRRRDHRRGARRGRAADQGGGVVGHERACMRGRRRSASRIAGLTGSAMTHARQARRQTIAVDELTEKQAKAEHARLAGRDRGARQALLPGRRADRLGRRVRRAAPALRRDRGALSRPAHAGEPVAARSAPRRPAASPRCATRCRCSRSTTRSPTRT